MNSACYTNKRWTRLAATQSTSAPLASYRHPAVLGQFYSVFWKLPGPAGHKAVFQELFLLSLFLEWVPAG